MSDVVDPAQAPSDEIRRNEMMRIRDRFFTAVSRGAAAGCVLRGGLTIAVSFFSLFSRKRSVSNRHPLEEIVRMSLFLGSLAGSYVAVDEAIASIWGKSRTSPMRSLIAGFCSGSSLLLLGSHGRHDSLVMYILVRSLVLLIRRGNLLDRRKLLFLLLTPTRMPYGDSALLTISAVQILYSYIMMPGTLPASYRHFLDRHCGLQPYIVRAMKEMVTHKQCSHGKAVDQLRNLKGTGHVPFYSAIPCRLLHPNLTCVQKTMQIFPQAYARALTVYLPVYLAPALLVHRNRLLTDFGTLVPRVVAGILRSSLFLSSFITIAYAGQCTVHNLAGFTNQWTLLAGFFIPGVASLTEKKSRRIELALYTFARALESFLQCLVEWGLIEPLQGRLNIWLFCFSVAVITHCYSDDEGRHRPVFRSKYLNVLDFIFGNSGIDHGRIHHTPSNQDLLDMGSHWWRHGCLDRLRQHLMTRLSSLF